MRPKCRRLLAEALECRRVLYGDVAVSVVAGDLVVTGDAEANKIALWIDTNSGDWMVGGGKINHPFAVPGSETLINGQLAPQAFSGVIGDLLIDLGDGDDDLEISNAALSGQTQINLGDGVNEAKFVTAFTFQNWIFNDNSPFVRGPLSFAGDISVVGGADLDQLVVGPAVDINANLSMTGNDGDDSFINSGVGPLEITGNVTFDMGSGENDVHYQSPITIDGDFTVIDEGSSSLLTSSVRQDDLTVTGAISITGGAGRNAVLFERLQAGSVTIALGDAFDVVYLIDSEVDVLDLDLGSGDDRETSLLGLTATTSIAVNTGVGADTLYVENVDAPLLDVQTGDDPDAVIVFDTTAATAATFDTGGGHDVIGVYTVTATTLSVLTGDGDEGGGLAFGVVVGTCNISGTLTVLSGTGLDNILLGSVTAADVLVDSDSGSDGVIVLYSNLGSVLIDSCDDLDIVGCHDSVFDDLTVLLGTGFDQLWFGNLTVNNTTDLDGEADGGEQYQSGTNSLAGLTTNLTPH